MKKRFLYIALIALTLGACTEQDIVEQPSIPTDGGTEVRLPADVNSGELLTPTGGRKSGFPPMSTRVNC